MVSVDNSFAYTVDPAIPRQWEMQPGLSAYKIIYNQNGKLISTSTLSDSRENASDILFLYIQTDKNLYRCGDYMDKDFHATGFMCYKLIDAR